ncbi:MAG: hypothetical protein OHK0054_01650 [Sideroxydans sp.]
MAIVMDMSSYQLESAEAATERYNDEILYAGWNPQISLNAPSETCDAAERSPFPPALAEIDIEAFLRLMTGRMI